MFKGFFIGCIVRPCPKLFDPIFALLGSKLGQFDPLNVSFRLFLHCFGFYFALGGFGKSIQWVTSSFLIESSSVSKSPLL